MNQFKIFVNGIVIGVLAFATANAFSFFVRSSSWAGLVSNHLRDQAIGFPFEIWRYGTTYSNGMVDSTAMNLNAGIAIGFGILIGCVLLAKSQWLTGFAAAMAAEEKLKHSDVGLRFSIRGLFLVTGACAVIASLARASIGARPELLWAIYGLGPLFLVGLAMIPKGLKWQYRVVLLTPSTLMLIGFAMYIGSRLDVDFERVMFGVFVCWVPQTIITAFLLTLRQAIRYNRSQGEHFG